MLTDTHTHVFSTEYENYNQILQELESNNIKRVILNGYDMKSNKEVLDLVKKYPNVYGSIGIHPNYVLEYTQNDIEYIKNNIDNKKIIAIGEIGLDYYRNPELKEKQKELFKMLLDIATENKKPVIIHNRNSTDDLLKILKDYKVRGIIHCFSGSIELAKEFIKLGYKLGIGGIVTFKNTNLPKTLSDIKIENILLETDSPYISPEPVRGLKNEPANLKYIFSKLKEIYNVDEKELYLILEDNFLQLFDI